MRTSCAEPAAVPGAHRISKMSCVPAPGAIICEFPVVIPGCADDLGTGRGYA